MTLLVFTGKGDKLTCKPPNQVLTTGKRVALIYFSPTTPKLLITANFVTESPFNDGTRRILSVTNYKGPPVYVPMKPNITEFELTLERFDTTPAKGNKNLLAILRVDDE